MPMLSGLRVWECASTPAVGMAGRLLAHMGADVQVLEGPGTDLDWPPFIEGRSAARAYLMAGKTSRPSPSDAAARAELADVNIVLTSERDVPDGWCWSPGTVPDGSAGRVLVTVTPYGPTGPKRDWLGSELTLFQAGGEGYVMPSGLAFEEHPDRPPVGVGRCYAHYQAGLTMALTALAGLRSSRRSGQTERVDISIQLAQLSLNYLSVDRCVDGVLETRANRAFTYGGVLPCADGYVELLPLEQHQWLGLRAMLGDPDWARDERFDDPVSRGRHGPEINERLRAWARSRAAEDVVAAATEHNVPCGRYVAPEELPEVPQLRARAFFVPAAEAEGVMPGVPWEIERAPASVTSR